MSPIVEVTEEPGLDSSLSRSTDHPKGGKGCESLGLGFSSTRNDVPYQLPQLLGPDGAEAPPSACLGLLVELSAE